MAVQQDANKPKVQDAEWAQRNFHTLDALRGVAAIAVVSLHASRFLAPILFSHGYLAVDLFFIMSGCVIDRAYQGRLQSRMPASEFMVIRLIRLYPLYVCGLIFGCVVSGAGMFLNSKSGWTPLQFGLAASSAFLFLPMPARGLGGPAYSLNPPAWTLFFELLINIVYALTLNMITLRRLIVLYAILSAIILVVAFSHSTLDLGYTFDTFIFGIPRVAFGFTAGVLISRLRRKSFRKFNGVEGLVLILIVAIVLFIGPLSGWWHAAWDSACVLVLFPLIVYRATLVDPPVWMQSTATFLGVTSYAIYVVHMPLLGLVLAFGGRLLVSHTAPVSGFMLVAALLCIAWSLDRWFDAPARRWLSQRLLNRVQTTGK